MNPKETVKTLQSAVQNGDFKKAKTFLSDDFQFSGPVPQPISGEQWLDMSGSLKTAFPAVDYHFGIEGADANVVHVSVQITGKHTGDLDLSAMGIGVIPATGKSVSSTQGHGDVTVRGDKVVSWAMEQTEGHDLTSLLSQIGVEVPAR
jgi:hypothetical protein